MCYDLISSINDKNINTLNHNFIENTNSFLALPGTRSESIEFISSSMSKSNSKDIYIIDPYFSQKDLEIIKYISNWCYGSSIKVLTSISSSDDFNHDSYINEWNDISFEEPPYVTFYSVFDEAKKSPFHDRWIVMLDKNEGIRLGTSFNSLGINKVSEISLIFDNEVKQINESVIVPFINERIRSHNNLKLKYLSFDL